MLTTSIILVGWFSPVLIRTHSCKGVRKRLVSKASWRRRWPFKGSTRTSAVASPFVPWPSVLNTPVLKALSMVAVKVLLIINQLESQACSIPRTKRVLSIAIVKRAHFRLGHLAEISAIFRRNSGIFAIWPKKRPFLGQTVCGVRKMFDSSAV